MNLNVMKRMLSFVLTLALLMSNVSAVAFATEEEILAPTEVAADRWRGPQGFL